MDKNEQKYSDILTSFLREGEILESWTMQRRIFALFHRREIIGATNGRLIILKRKLIAGFKLFDIRWQDLVDIIIEDNIFGSKLTIRKKEPNDLEIDKKSNFIFSIKGLKKKGSKLIYRFSQKQEEAWREKRRVREIEELKAKSGTLNIESLNKKEAASENLDLLKRLADNKLMTDTEIETIKARLINSF